MQSVSIFRRHLRRVSRRLPLLSSLYQTTPFFVACSAAALPQPVPANDALQDSALFQFRVLKTENELSAVVARLGERLSSHHVVAAFARLSQLGTPIREDTLDCISTKAAQLAPSMSARDVVALLSSCRNLPGAQAILIRALVRRLITRESLLQMNGPLIARVLTTLVSLQLSPQSSPASNGHSKALPSVLLFEVLQEMSQLVSQEGFAERLSTAVFVETISAFGALRFQSPLLHNIISREIVKPSRIEAMRSQELTAVWRAVAELQVTDIHALETFSRELTHNERLRSFKASELVTLVVASRQLQPFRHWPSLEKLLQESVKPDRLKAFTEAQLVHLVVALKGLQIRDLDVITALLEEITEPHRLPFFTRQFLSSLMCSLKALGYGSHPKMELLMAGAGQPTQEHGLNNKQRLSSIFQEFHGPQERLDTDVLEQLLTSGKLGALSDGTLLQLLARHHQQDSPDEAQRAICVKEVVKRLSSGSPQVLSHFAYGLSHYQIQSHDILAALATEAVRADTLHQLEASQLAGILHALSSLGWKEATTFNALFTEICRTGRLGVLSERGLANVIAAVQLSGGSFDGVSVEILHEATRPQRLLQFTQQSLISIIISIGRMRFHGRPWTHCIYNEATKSSRLARLSNLELTTLIYNLAQLREKSSQGINRIKHEIMQPHRLRKLKRSELAQLVYGLGGIRVREHDLSQAIGNHIMASVNAAALRNCDLTNLLHGLSCMQCSHIPCLQKLMTEGLLPARLESFAASEFTSLVYAFSQLSISDPHYLRPLLGAIDQSERLCALADQQLIRVFTSTSLLLSRQSTEFKFPEALLQTVSQPERLSSLLPHQFASLTNCLGRDPFREHYPGFIAALTAQLCRKERLMTLSPPELAQISQSLARAGLEEHPAADSIADELMRRLLKGTEL